jgi:hypothetical protein
MPNGRRSPAAYQAHQSLGARAAGRCRTCQRALGTASKPVTSTLEAPGRPSSRGPGFFLRSRRAIRSTVGRTFEARARMAASSIGPKPHRVAVGVPIPCGAREGSALASTVRNPGQCDTPLPAPVPVRTSWPPGGCSATLSRPLAAAGSGGPPARVWLALQPNEVKLKKLRLFRLKLAPSAVARLLPSPNPMTTGPTKRSPPSATASRTARVVSRRRNLECRRKGSGCPFPAVRCPRPVRRSFRGAETLVHRDRPRLGWARLRRRSGTGTTVCNGVPTISPESLRPTTGIGSLMP